MSLVEKEYIVKLLCFELSKCEICDVCVWMFGYLVKINEVFVVQVVKGFGEKLFFMSDVKFGGQQDSVFEIVLFVVVILFIIVLGGL